MHTRPGAHTARATLVTLALAGGIGSAQVVGPPSQAALQPLQPVAAPVAHRTPGPGEVMARTELYFGTEKPGPDVSNRQFHTFLATQITPRIPDGLTVYQGYGQFKDSTGRIVRERALVVVLFYPTGTSTDSGAKIEAIRTAYKKAFQQESVLRADSADRVSF